MYPQLISFLYISLSKQQSTPQCYILAVHDVTESVLVRGDCRSSARHGKKNLQRLKSLLRLSQRLKSLVRGHPNGLCINGVISTALFENIWDAYECSRESTQGKPLCAAQLLQQSTNCVCSYNKDISTLDESMPTLIRALIRLVV